MKKWKVCLVAVIFLGFAANSWAAELRVGQEITQSFGGISMVPQSDPPANPASGDMYFDDSGAFCGYVDVTTGWVTLAGSGSCEGIPVVTSAGQVWMDRNLGASQVATSSTDSAAYGDLYQ